MNVAIFSVKKYDREFLNAANGSLHKLRFFEPHLNEETVSLATGSQAVCVFVNDQVNAAVIARLHSFGVRLIALRCAGYNNVDLVAATKHDITVVRVPAYSPYAVAEHTIALMLALNRKLHRAYNRVREGNFALDGLLGFDMHGTGQIGTMVAQILTGFGCPTLRSIPFQMRPVGRGVHRAEGIVRAIRHHHAALPAYAGEKILHARSLIEHRGYDDRQHHQVREQSAARKAGRLIPMRLNQAESR